jgi:hypothetical protein
VEQLDHAIAADALATEADIVFLALPDSAAADLAPALVDAGVRVIDLSGAFRLRDAGVRGRWYPETHRLPSSVAYGLTEIERDAVAGARLVANPGCYPTRFLRSHRWCPRGFSSPAPMSSSTPSRVCRRREARRRTHFSECHGSLSAYSVSTIGTGWKSSRESACRYLHPAPGAAGPGHLVDHLRASGPGTTEEALGDVRAGLCRRHVRAAHRLGVARDRRWRIPISATSVGASTLRPRDLCR